MLGVMLMIILLQGGKCRHEESLLVEAENRHKNVTNPSSPIPAILSENGITEGSNNTTTLTPQLQTGHNLFSLHVVSIPYILLYYASEIKSLKPIIKDSVCYLISYGPYMLILPAKLAP